MNEGSDDVLGTISLVTGLIGLIGQGFCCVPLISMVATFVVPASIFTAIGTGIGSILTEQGSRRGKIGLALGLIDALIILVFLGVITGLYGTVFMLTVINDHP